ncbi:MAG: Cna B-type domain-containing protein, partial [Clostridiales bacterium]|nr:Cna B-type domain-containing protein [Clostridiales bacterium]
MLNISSKMKKILTTIISLIVLVGIGVATNMVVTNNNIQLNSKAHKAPSIEERRAINGTVNVTFDAYFLNNSERTNEALLGPIVGPIVRTIPTKDIYMELSVVGDGYLKDGKILLQPTNGKISTTLVTDNVINGTYVGTPNEIKLKNVQSGTTRIIKGVVNPWILGKDYFLRNDNKIIFKGTYVSADGQETPLEKEVRYTVESMYEYIKAYSEKSYTRYTEIPKEYYSKDTKPHANFRIFNRGEQINESSRRTHNNYVAITSNTVKDLEYRAIVPEFNGYKAESVQVIVNNKLKNENVTTTYNKDTRELIIKYKEIGYDQNTLIEVVYPKESGDSKASEEVEITGTLRILADNNPKYTNPLEDIVTSTDKRKIEYYEIAELRYYPNYIDILKAPTTDNPLDRYDGNTTLAKTEEYSVVWRPYSEEMTTNEIELTENKRKYGDTLGASEINIKDVVVNTGIKFTIKPENLTENSTIKIYDDETNELIREYNKTEILENNDRDNKYNRPVKHVKIVLNNIKIHNRSDNYFIHYKEINDEELIKLTNKEAFEKLSYIKTGLTQKIGTTSVYAEDSTAYRKTSEPTVDIRLYDHNKINEQIAYNGIKQEKDNDITYHMTMYFTKGTKGIRLVDENGFSLLRADGNFENGVNASEYIKYKGIYFYQNQKLVDNFNLKIYDNDTNELLATFTKADIEKYNKEEKAFIYPEKVKHIRIDSNDNISMLHIINIDNNKLVQNVDLNTYIDEIKYIGIKSKFARIVEEGQEYTKFKDIATTGDAFIQKSRIDAEIDKPVNTYQKQKDITNTIYLRDVAKDNKGYYEQTFKGWKDSTILIEYPEEIKKVEINKIIPSDENIKILGYDKFEFEGKQYLKIYIKSDVEYKDQSININENLTADPLAKSKNALAKIYYYNAYPVEHSQYETETADKFDINNNGRTDDIIGLSSFSISIVSPDTLVVTQEMTGYNTKNETTYAPGTGIIESNGSGTATVKIQLANYWTPTVSNVKLIGKIPFRNNITPLSKQTLKSTFSTTMTEDGIQLPEELKSFAKVYYSELEDPGVNEVSAWKEKSQVTNWNNIKSFYIDLGSKILNPQEKQTITYKVNVPLDTPVNERTYSTVAATFDLNTERDGNLSSTAESNKVGIQLLKRYNLNVSSLVKGKTNPVADSVYSVENNEDDEDLAISKTVVTDQSGNAIVKDLRVNEEYTLTEKSIDSNYEERNIKIKFKLVEQNGRLELQVTEGNEYVKEKSEVQPTERTNAIANIKFEYLKKYKITINKKSEKTKENLKYVAYKLSGNDNSTSQQGSTDENGNLTFSSLKTNVIYTLTETFAPKHYLNAPITFRATETNGVPNIELLSGHSESISISETNEKQNQANISIFDEKVKTYTLKVVKYEKGNLNKRLKNAQFLIKGDGIPNGKVIETDENGEATLTDLYEYKEGQSYKGEYTIEELVAPEGYKGKYKVGVLVKRDAAQIARVYATTTELDIKNAESDHPTVYFFVPNEPLFKIIKKDAKTQELLPNTKFAIVKVDESGRESEALDINDNPVGNQEEINGKTYRTILTDDKGEYTAGLKAGRYKFIELQASNDKYDLPEREEDRTYTVNVGEASKAKYVLKENTHINKAISNKENYVNTGVKVTYVNGQSVTYKITDENGKKYLNIYDKEFNITKKTELKGMREIDRMTEMNIGKDGSIYIYSPKIGTTKFDSEGNFLYRSNDEFFGGIYNNGIRGPSNQFGSFLIDNDNKILSGRNDSFIDVYSNISSAKLLSNYDRQKRIVKPSFFGGFLELVYNHSNGVVNIYKNDLSIEKTFNINTKYKSGEWLLFNIANIYEDTEGNIYVENTDENKIDVYNREGTLLKQINKLGNEFTVLPDGRIYFIDFKHEEKNQINVKLILTENNGDKIYEKSLENVRYWPYENKLGININADGSIDYTNSDENNMYSEMINHRLDLEIETPAQPPQSEIVVENKLKKFKITTSSSIGGTISGKGENPYEEVEINSDSNKPIEIKADEGYVIAKIVINGEEYPISDEHNITLTKFNNITEDKNINVVFDLASNVARYKIQTFHYLKGTNTEVAPTVINYYNERENTYITEPKILEKYELEKNEQGEYIIPTNATGDAITANKTGNNSVIYYYVKKKAKVITKYILEKTDGSTEEIKPTDEQTLEVDSEYRTSGEINNTKYELIRIDGNARGTIESTEDINVTYVYKLKDAKVNVKYLDVTESETGTPLSSRDGTIIADKVINGQVDDAYRTQEAENVQPNYSLVETPRNASGTMTIDPITVVYKYRKVTPTINDINVTKVGPNKIVSKNQLNTYNITFNVDISNYIGSGKVRLTDKLPYEIHYEDIDKLATGLFLDGGIYNNETKEIIWDIPITDINTYKQADDRNENNVVITQNGNSAHITINKTISIRYKDLPNYNQGEEPKIENSIFGKVILDRNNEREVNSKYNSPANYNTAIIVKKKWNDNSNSAEKRPTSITFALYKTINGQETKVKDYTLTGNKTTNDGWETKIEQLPIYDGVTQSREIGLERAGELGNRITYRVEETTNNKFYQSAATTHSENEFLLTNTFTVPDEKIEVQVNKVWDDNSNANAKRPTSIKYVLNGGKSPVEQVVTGNTTTNDGWGYKFTNLAKYDDLGNEITYTVSEQEATTDGLKFYTNRVSGEYKTGLTITNTFTVPDNKVEVIATKHWEDANNANGKRPLSIKYVLNGGRTPIEQVVSGNRTTDADWAYTFTNLPKYDAQGNEISYSVDEQEVNSGDLKFYTKSKLKNRMINTFTVPDEKINVPVTKHWEDGNNANGKRPTSIKYVLTGNGLTKEQVVTGNTTSDADWNYTFTNLPKYDAQGNEIAYTVEEQEVNANDLKFYAKSKTNYDLTNTFKVPNEKIEVSVTKHWEDNSNANGKRPVSVKYVLTGNGLTKEQIVTGNSTTDDNWSYTFTDLPKYNSQGNEIVYTVDEKEANTDGLKFYQKSIRGSNIINTFTVPDDKIEVAVTKTWLDSNNANRKRPTSVKYIVSGNGLNKEQVVTGNSTTDADWNYTFTNLPKYDAQGNEIVYTIDEQ